MIELQGPSGPQQKNPQAKSRAGSLALAEFFTRPQADFKSAPPNYTD